MFESTADFILSLACESGTLSLAQVDDICRMHGQFAEDFWLATSDPENGYSEDNLSAADLCAWLGY